MVLSSLLCVHVCQCVYRYVCVCVSVKKTLVVYTNTSSMISDAGMCQYVCVSVSVYNIH
jgi:hypothetical protein